jgi:ubiquinone/menaquinone biosynthesis C-methylase UbiE
MSETGRDRWAEWLLHRRFGGDPDELRRTLDFLEPIRDRVLANAAIAPGETLLDVGCGDGLIAFGALERVGRQGRVVFGDVSQDLLDHARGLANGMGVADRCRFVRASADDLAPIADASVDVVTTRSVLIYVAAKQRAFAEFFRVLRPGGRISLFEPINRFAYSESTDRFWGYDAAPILDEAAKVRAVFHRRQPLDTDPMMDFDERDLLAFAERAGFGERHLELRVDVEAHPPRRWETFARTAFNPLIPSIAEAMAEALTAAEAERFAAHLRPLVEVGRGAMPFAMAYLWAAKA